MLIRPLYVLLYISLTLFLGACQQQGKEQEEIRDVGLQNEYTSNIRLKNLTDEVKRNPGNATGWFKRASLLFDLGDNVEARRDARQSISLDTAKGESWALLARIHRKDRRIDSAVYATNKAKLLKYESPSLYVSSGELWLILRRYDDALADLNRSLEIAPSNPEAYFYKGYVYEEKGDTGSALSNYQTAIEQNPEYVDAYNKLAKMYMNRGKFSLAERYLRSGLRFAPQNALLHFNMGMMFINTKQMDSARAYLAKATFFDNALAPAQTQLGLFSYQERNYLDAANRFEASLQADPNQAMARFYLGLCRENSGNLEEAVQHYQEVLKLNNGYVKESEKAINRIRARQQGQQRQTELEDSLGAMETE